MISMGRGRWVASLFVAQLTFAQNAPAPSTPEIRTTSTLVLVPALVRSASGELLLGLNANDFSVTDNGVEQKVTLEEVERQPVSILVVMQTGGAGTRQFENYRNLPILLDAMGGSAKHEAAVMTFDSAPEDLFPFVSNTARLKEAFAHPHEGDHGAAVLDAVNYAIDLLKDKPATTRRILLLLSQPQDDGSKVQAEEVVRRLGENNITIFSVSFSPEKTWLKVGNVVVEFGDASQQETIDRYISGEEIPYEQLRKVWADTAGWVPTVTALGYINFYAEVRAANLNLPRSQRIHVLLGDPPIDWSKIETRADLSRVADRNQYPADLIKANLLAKKKRALIIYGAGHLSGDKSLKTLIEQSYPGSFFVVTPYFGFTDRSCSEAFERKVSDWPKVALVTPVRKSSLENEMHAPGCHFVSASDFTFDKTATEAQKAEVIADTDDKLSGVAGDALLYLGPASRLTQSPLAPDLYLDTIFRKEIARRFQIVTGGPLTWPSAADNPASPRYFRSYGGFEVGRE